MKTYAHPVLGIIRRLERMWSETDQIAMDRARIIVDALVKEGMIKGDVFNETPLPSTLAERWASFRFVETTADADSVMDQQGRRTI